MPSPLSIFLDFNLPNSTTWFYFSFLLAMALFYKFSRGLSMRNLDVVMLFLLVPGLLVVQASKPQPLPIEQQPVVQIASLFGHVGLAETPGVLATHVGRFSQQCGPALESYRWAWFGYLWLLVGSVYFFCRCLLDLTLVQRPSLAPNLQIGGLAWLAGALLICMLAVAFRQVDRPINSLPSVSNGSSSAALILPGHEQSVFGVAILWWHWPAWGVAALAFACHLLVIVMLALIAWRHFQDIAAGMAAVTFYLVLPYTGLYVGQLHHVLPMTLFLGAILAYRYPTLAGSILGIASAATYFPLFVLPLWLHFYRYRGAGRFLIAFLFALTLGLANVAITLWLHDELEQSIQLARDFIARQTWRIPPTTTEGFWTGVAWAYRLPVLLLFLSFVFSTMFWPSPKNLAQVIALSAAIFISLQWWYADQGGIYILWYLPLLLLLVFRPNLQDRLAPPIDAETDWLARSMGWCVRFARRLVKLPEASEKANAA